MAIKKEKLPNHSSNQKSLVEESVISRFTNSSMKASSDQAKRVRHRHGRRSENHKSENIIYRVEFVAATNFFSSTFLEVSFQHFLLHSLDLLEIEAQDPKDHSNWIFVCLSKFHSCCVLDFLEEQLTNQKRRDKTQKS